MSRLDKVLGLLAAFGVFLLSRPYQGVRHDGRLYVADALAKLDPAGVGKDLMFVHDGQFGFSLYTPMLAKLIAVLGLSGGAMAIVVVTLAAWFAALAVLIHKLLADRSPGLRWAALLFAVALPALYGPLDVIGFGEPYATPRALAEAAGFLGMASFLSGRRFLGLGLCVPGMLFHPIMGLCAAAAIGLAMCFEDRRWLWAGLAGIAVVTLAGLLHLPVAERIVTVMDPDWRAVVAARSPILFPSLWPIETWSRLTVQACTLAAGAFLLSGAPRRLALGALIAGLVGVAATVLLGDRLSLLLFLQVQAWRMLEPLAVLAAASLALLCAELPRRGPSGLLGLAFLGCAWMFREVGTLGISPAMVGLLFAVVGDRMRYSRPSLYATAAMGLLAVSALFYIGLRGVALTHALERLPPAWPFSQGYVWSSDLPGLAIVLVVGLWLARGWKAPAVPVRIAAAAAVGLLAAALWDDRSAYVRHRDEGTDAALVALTASKPGAVLWVSGDVEPWQLMGRPTWSSKEQSAGVVFSRPLAMVLAARATRLQAAGLVGKDWMRTQTVAAQRVPGPNAANVRAFCAASDAPAWIVRPLWNDEGPLAPALRARDWTPKAPYVLELTDASGSAWRTADRYAVIPCAGD
uniref:hypothetical protein n=1 Tax=uncultured Caulobacter sp. TaxID=158749 RepID=UPI0025F4FF5A|nr:hypothetical protein [uncultured Caulobacter sp.]